MGVVSPCRDSLATVPNTAAERSAEGSQNESEILHGAFWCNEGFPNICFRWGFEFIYRQWVIGPFGNPAISVKTRLSSGNAKGVGDWDVFNRAIIAHLNTLLLFYFDHGNRR